MKSEYKLIDNPDIFELKSDLENAMLFTKSGSSMSLVVDTRLLVSCIYQNVSIYRKKQWTDKLDGKEENAVLCEVWDDRRNPLEPNIEWIIHENNGTGYPFTGINASWKYAEPVPAEMVDFINRK